MATRICGTLLLISVTLLTASGCETTGNPREGGLFGWNRHKADERHRVLQQEAAQADRNSAAEQQRRLELQTQTGDLSDQQTQLQHEVDKLAAENLQLEKELTELIDRTQLSSGELSRVRALLKQNQQRRAQLQTTGDPRPEAMHQQNQTLHREIMALLGR
jgi:predicted  nucleic acid-binding Zn-ribbon protein